MRDTHSFERGGVVKVEKDLHNDSFSNHAEYAYRAKHTQLDFPPLSEYKYNNNIGDNGERQQQTMAVATVHIKFIYFSQVPFSRSKEHSATTITSTGMKE